MIRGTPGGTPQYRSSIWTCGTFSKYHGSRRWSSSGAGSQRVCVCVCVIVCVRDRGRSGLRGGAVGKQGVAWAEAAGLRGARTGLGWHPAAMKMWSSALLREHHGLSASACCLPLGSCPQACAWLPINA